MGQLGPSRAKSWSATGELPPLVMYNHFHLLFLTHQRPTS